MDKMKLETTVGFFVLLGLVIFFIIVFFISGIYFLRDGFYVRAEFDYTAGLNKGASVRLAGVRVGEVNKVYLDYDKVTNRPFAVVDMWIESGVKIRDDAKAYILGTFALNETLIEIMQDQESTRPFVRDGDLLEGIEPLPMEKIMEHGMALSKRFAAFSDKLDAIMGDEEIQKAFRTTILDMSRLLDYTNTMIIEKDIQINSVVDNLDSTLARLRSILDSIDSGEGTLGKLVNDDELYTDVQHMIREIDSETKSLIREIKRHPWRLLKKDKDTDKDTSEKKKRFLGIF
jgi:phospholipid/cholesterol/gamma-HCH transport system substrate-binding protein